VEVEVQVEVQLELEAVILVVEESAQMAGLHHQVLRHRPCLLGLEPLKATH
jgi:hypothetical protein